MVEPIHVVVGLFFGGLALAELSGKTDLLGRRKTKELLERHETALEEESEPTDDGPRF